MGGEIGVKTIVYNTKRDQKKRREKKTKKKKKRERERKRLKKYNSKKKEFCTLDHTTRAWPRILFVFVHL